MTMDAGGKPHGDLDHPGIQFGAWIGHTRAGDVGAAEVPGQAILDMPVKHGGHMRRRIREAFLAGRVTTDSGHPGRPSPQGQPGSIRHAAAGS